MIFANTHHYLQNSRGTYNGYEITPAPECPARFDAICAALNHAGIGPIIAAPERSFDGPARKIHDPNMVNFLARAWDQWRLLFDGLRDDQIGDAIPGTSSLRTHIAPLPEQIDAALGYWCSDTCTPLQPGTWQAVCGSVATALAGADYLAQHQKSVFSLCRPPGHHAGRARFGGFCFLNNAAIAVQQLQDQGVGRVALLDVDYHHGDGSQDIFNAREDVLFVSIHADPAFDYPYYAGFADEQGTGAGLGFNLNIPLPLGTSWSTYHPALKRACDRIVAFKPDALVLSFGADTFGGDPIGKFRLQSDDFWAMGDMIAQIGLPTLTVMEGGYALSALGENVVQFLSGLEGRIS